MLRYLTDYVRVFIDFIMPNHKSLFDVDIDSGTVGPEAPDRGQSFFLRRRALLLPAGPIPIHTEETHVTGIEVKKSITDAV
jgi:hypothetical protein